MDDVRVPEFMELIRPHTGDVTDVRPAAGGYNSATTVLVECDKGQFFVKAVPNRPGGRRDSLIREALINPFAVPLSPAVRWQVEDNAWIALGFEAVEGRPADFAPDSPDLPAVVGILNRIGALPLPEVVEGWPETRWDRFADLGAAALFQGRALLYTDINPGNLLIGRRDAWAVDWSWPTRGAAWIDPACLVVQLVAAGHNARSAESWAAGCASWEKADRKAVDAFAVATARMYRRAADRRPGAEWLVEMSEAAMRWADHRGVAVVG
ncbi:hypothetical protein SAMN05421505_102319 [Sinosporangium album]|uniref:Phosphotransferase enzyme family protein n=1 Tax=Sinosporangium album TaxID=504805 RepID=A0A1G7SIA6_9ACTN|nr:protein kinase [Sinosporangium album]SDG22738.1 hypothetical protein SAMN05421505_102319 [Sinosporangium album]